MLISTGIININTKPSRAIVLSPTVPKSNDSLQILRVIHAKAISPKTIETCFSAERQASILGKSNICLLETFRVSQNAISGMSIMTIGIAILI